MMLGTFLSSRQSSSRTFPSRYSFVCGWRRGNPSSDRAVAHAGNDVCVCAHKRTHSPPRWERREETGEEEKVPFMNRKKDQWHNFSSSSSANSAAGRWIRAGIHPSPLGKKCAWHPPSPLQETMTPTHLRPEQPLLGTSHPSHRESPAVRDYSPRFPWLLRCPAGSSNVPSSDPAILRRGSNCSSRLGCCCCEEGGGGEEGCCCCCEEGGGGEERAEGENPPTRLAKKNSGCESSSQKRKIGVLKSFKTIIKL